MEQSAGQDAALAAACLRSAAGLYQGEFLAGFFVDDSLPFSEWASMLRERLHYQALDTIFGLAELAEKLGQYPHAYELATFVIHHPLTEHYIHEGASALLEELKPQLTPAAAAAAEGRARTWTLNDVVAELLAPSGD